MEQGASSRFAWSFRRPLHFRLADTQGEPAYAGTKVLRQKALQRHLWRGLDIEGNGVMQEFDLAWLYVPCAHQRVVLVWLLYLNRTNHHGATGL
jgi:hypothetical protein